MAEPSVVAPERARRLHPFSWLFVLIAQLRPVALPALALLLFGRGAWWELLGAVGAGALALYALIYSLGFRYRLGADELVVREGLFARTERHVPYGRIQNVVRKQNLLHRAFGVAELRLESGGGSKPEAVMNVVRLTEALRIEAVLRAHGIGEGHRDASATDPASRTADPQDAAPVLLTLPTAELVRLGLVTNRGVLAVGAAFAVAFQFEPWDRGSLRSLFRVVREGLLTWSHLFAGWVALAAASLALLLAFVLVLKLLSVAMAIVSFHGFTLKRRGARVATDAGLLTRHAANARLDRIQRLVFGETWLARRIDRRWVSCDIAAGAVALNEAEGTRLRWLAPIASPDALRRVIDGVAPGLDPERLTWRPLHPAAWRRMLVVPVMLWSVVCAGPGALWLGPWAALAWVLAMIWSVLEARGTARFAGYAWQDGVFAARTGWLERQWTVARLRRGQSVTLSQSPFDRRRGMASVELDTAGAALTAPRLRVDYLPEAEARALADSLSALLGALPDDAGAHAR